ncbi:MAG: peptidoglycan DD-metalloendopeptidase family protein [Ndongobacter sp.]|nr:peptidoglycan DD-metalloendopeptidase family protein [Ndongobacter sp.]
MFLEKKQTKRLLSLVLAGLLLLPSAAWADELDDVEQQQEQKEAEIQEIRDQKSGQETLVNEKSKTLNSLTENQQALQSELQELDASLETEYAQLNQLNEDIAELEEKIAQTESEIAELEVRIADKKAVFRDRLNVMYKNGDIATLEILLASTGMNDFLSRSRTMKAVADYDRDLIQDLISDMQLLEKKQTELQGQKTCLDIAKENQTAKVEELQEQQARKNEILAQVNLDIELTESEMQKLQAASDAMQSKIDAKLAELEELKDREKQIESDRAAAAAVAESVGSDSPSSDSGASSGGYSPQSSSGGNVWPTTSYEVTSPYGYRIHPIFGTLSFHTGIDLGADYGEPVYATSSGTVTTVTYGSGYGNYIELAHDDGNGSLYAHLSGFNCYAGQHVEKGQIIGYIGSTGNSTGPHLHFEFYDQGVRVNPLAYL